jgi:hypothetical protein
LTVELQEFNIEEVGELVQQYQLPWNSKEIRELFNLVGGHPYLIKEALEQIAQQRLTLEQILQIAHTEAGLYGDHLRRQMLNLEQNPQLLEAMKQVIATNIPVPLTATQRFQLHRMGLVHLEGSKVRIRCELYKKYFCDCFGVTE